MQSVSQPADFCRHLVGSVLFFTLSTMDVVSVSSENSVQSTNS